MLPQLLLEPKHLAVVGQPVVGQPAERQSWDLHVAEVTTFGSMRKHVLKFDDYIVLNDLQTVLKRDSNGNYKMHLTTGMVTACTVVAPQGCDTSQKIWQRVERVSGKLACQAIKPGMIVSGVKVPTVKEGEKIKIQLGGAEYEIDLYHGVFIGKLPGVELVRQPKFIGAVVDGGMNVCQAEFLQAYLDRYIEMLEKLPNVLNKTPDLGTFFDLL